MIIKIFIVWLDFDACTVFDRSNTWVVCSNPTWGEDVHPRLSVLWYPCQLSEESYEMPN